MPPMSDEDKAALEAPKKSTLNFEEPPRFEPMEYPDDGEDDDDSSSSYVEEVKITLTMPEALYNEIGDYAERVDVATMQRAALDLIAVGLAELGAKADHVELIRSERAKQAALRRLGTLLDAVTTAFRNEDLEIDGEDEEWQER